jgi:hypothetical protein
MIRLYQLSHYTVDSKTSPLSLNGEIYNVLDFYQKNQRNTSFNQSGASKLGGQITECDTLIDIPVGTAHGNHSYGGYCVFQKGGDLQKVRVCDDDMVGHFKMEPASEAQGLNDLAIFVVNNCFGG